MKKKLCLLLACVTALGILFSSCGNKSTGEGVMSDFTTTDLEGNTVDESVFADYQMTMVNVWATFCTPCLSEMPDLGELAAEYQDQGGPDRGPCFRYAGYGRKAGPNTGGYGSRDCGTDQSGYRHLLPSEELFGLLSQISSVPTTFFVNSKGEQVGSAYLGAQSKEDWEIIIEQTLAEL